MVDTPSELVCGLVTFTINIREIVPICLDIGQMVGDPVWKRKSNLEITAQLQCAV